MLNKVTVLLEQCEWHFQQKIAVRSVKLRSHSFPCLTLLLSTTVLNDTNSVQILAST